MSTQLDKTSRRKSSPKWFDPRSGSPPFRMQAVAIEPGTFQPKRTNYFSIYWIESGAGSFCADTAEHSFAPEQLLFFVPYQYIRFQAAESVQGILLNFHANFLCVETFHTETGCSGTLFNDPYGLPIVSPDPQCKDEIVSLLSRMQNENTQQLTAYEDVLLASLKILLILAARSKSSAQHCNPITHDFRNPVLATLRELIEENYRRLHAPSAYARLLHMTPKTLGRQVREQLGKTLTDLIRDRVLTHAKWQLLHTLRPVKEIANEVGFQDELYFSRLFKKATGVSPTFFREFETQIRGGSNLSMTSSHASIQSTAQKVDS